MARQIKHFYEFGSVRLDATSLLLYRDGEQLPLQPRVVQTLLVLVENSKTVVDKETLLASVWQDVIVEEGGLKRNISLLRKALGEDGSFIETLPKRGYRFAAEVKEVWEEVRHGVDGGRAAFILRRRANLQIRQEEEASHAGEPRPRRVATRELLAALRRRGLILSAGAIVLLAALLGIWRVTNGSIEAKPPTIKSIAVLPFKLLAPRGGDEHLGIGMSDVLITRLSNIRDLKVRPTSAVLRFGDKEQDSIAAGKMLGVDAVLEGSIYRAGDRMRITARLVRVSDQAAVWAGQLDEKAADFLSMQNTIAQNVASSLALNLSSAERNALSKRYTEDADAYQLYVTGRHHWNKRSGDAMAQAETFFRRAIEKDPDFALAYLGLADILTMGGIYGESKALVEKAIEMEGDLGEAFASRGFWKMFKEWEWGEAEADFKRSIELNPGYGTAHQWYATLLAITGRVEEAKAQMRLALEIDPMSYNFLADLGQMHYFAREYEEAESNCKKALEIYPDFVLAHVYLKQIYLVQGEADKAFEEEMKERKAIYPYSTDQNADAIVARREASARELYRRSGYEALWREAIGHLLNRRADNFTYHALGLYYTMLGDKERALQNLEKAYENREFMLPFVNADPLYDSLRSEPRFQEVVRRLVGRPESRKG